MEKQNNEKLSDKAFARLFLTSILGILVCIICLCSTTYAWFTGSVQVDSNKIQTADACLLSVSVYKDGAKKFDKFRLVEFFIQAAGLVWNHA